MNSQNDWSGHYFLMRKGYEALPESRDIDLLAGEVYFNHWSRRLSPFKTLAEGDTVYLLDIDRRALAVELRVATKVASSYDTIEEGMAELANVFGVVQPPGGWPGYDPDEGPGFLLAYNVDVIASIDIPFEFGWDVLGGHNGYISVETFAASDRIDSVARDAVLAQLPKTGRAPLAQAGSADTRGVASHDLHKMAPRIPSLAVKKAVNARSSHVCESQGCKREARHFDHIVPWSKGGNSDLVNIQHLCEPCNLSKSDRMPASYLPEQMWIRFVACDLDGDSVTVGDQATAVEVRTKNSVYDVVYDGDTMLAWKRGQRRVWCASHPGDRGFMKVPKLGTVLAGGVDERGKPVDGLSYFRTSTVEAVKDVPVDETLQRIGKSVGTRLQFTN